MAALAQQTRIRIFPLQVQQGPDGLPASVLAEKLGLPNATFSFHVKELSQAGLVTARQSGRFIYYSADYTAMNALVGYLTENCCGGDARINIISLRLSTLSAYLLKIFGFAAYSGSGKPTLIENVLPLPVVRDLRVSVIKHAHHAFDVDQPDCRLSA
ncbi:MAG: molybdopterin-guanine dinucleotide biosynthesis protein MobB [Betaproteobacteria bacterium]